MTSLQPVRISSEWGELPLEYRLDYDRLWWSVFVLAVQNICQKQHSCRSHCKHFPVQLSQRTSQFQHSKLCHQKLFSSSQYYFRRLFCSLVRSTSYWWMLEVRGRRGGSGCTCLTVSTPSSSVSASQTTVRGPRMTSTRCMRQSRSDWLNIISFLTINILPAV